MVGNWKLEAIITAIAKNNEITARDIAAETPLSSRQVGLYIKHNLAGKYVKSHKIPAQQGNSPWIRLYSLTQIGREKYRRMNK